MIPAIGIMIGAYIVTRMIELLAGSSTSGRSAARVSAVFTIVVVAVVMLDLLLGSAITADFPLPYRPDR